jgi:DNA-binding PadR family transcriptional regulator
MATRNMRTVHAAAVTPAEFHILLALVDEDRHGYAVMQQVAADSAGAVRLGPGTLYGAIKRLLDYGYIREVESRIDPDLDDARRKYYRLTMSGRAAAMAEAERLASLVRLARAKQLIDAPARARGGRS